MTRKHFERIAQALRASRPDPAADTKAHKHWISLCKTIAAICADDNPGFQHNTFYEACGMEPKA